MPNLSQHFSFQLVPGSSDTSVSIPSNAVPMSSNGIIMDAFYSLPLKGDGYFGDSDGIHTVTYTVDQGFDGRISMQGSLSTTPTNNDWFSINNTEIVYTQMTSLTQHTKYVNFTGNFVWVRAKVIKNNGSMLIINYNR
jgi:hypothetical protein